MTQHPAGNHQEPTVVNCFQICIFVSDDTAFLFFFDNDTELWIAFKFVSLYRMTQQYSCLTMTWPSCELLSNLYLCIGWHSIYLATYLSRLVVNCFQICIFVSDDTATYSGHQYNNALWIAFKFVSLYRMTQLDGVELLLLFCCELLSNLYLCIGWHSPMSVPSALVIVVNCFQICIFVSDDTARWSQIITNQSDTKISH